MIYHIGYRNRPSSRKVNIGAQDRNLETRTGADSREILITDLFLLESSTTIFIKPRSITPRMAPCTLP